MKLSFLIQLMFLLLLVVGIYLIFTDSIQGKMKIILIIFCFFMGSYLFFKLPVFKDHNEIISSPLTAEDSYKIGIDDMKPAEGPIGVSTWIYIDDWNVKYGKKKIIMKPINRNDNYPTIFLHKHKNDLSVSVNVVRDNGYIDPVTQKPVTFDDDDESIEGVKPPSNSERRGTTIENISIQKWVNIIVTFNNRTLDVYINGKLVKSTPFDNVIHSKNVDGIKITPNGGFGGFVSKTQYFPSFITPAKAWKIYRGGFGDMFASALNKYNLSVTFYEDSVARNKYTMF